MITKSAEALKELALTGGRVVVGICMACVHAISMSSSQMLIDLGWGPLISQLWVAQKCPDNTSLMFLLAATIGNLAEAAMSLDLVHDLTSTLHNLLDRIQSNDAAVRQVANTTHGLSCNERNIAGMIRAGVVETIRLLVGRPTSHDEDHLTLCVATLYNLCTEPETQATLVQQGVVALLYSLSTPQVAEGSSRCMLATRAACLLACGQVNTNRFLRDKGGDMVRRVAEESQRLELEDLVRCAAGLRNMLSAGGSLRFQMVQGEKFWSLKCPMNITKKMNIIKKI